MSAWAGLALDTPDLPPDAHITLVYAEKLIDMDDFRSMRRIARSLSQQFFAGGGLRLNVHDTALFGPNADVPVLLVDYTHELTRCRIEFAEFADTRYGEYRPHVAVPDFSYIPEYVWAAGIKVSFSEGWGKVGSME